MYHHLVLSQGALLALINTFDPFQQKETRESIQPCCGPSWGWFTLAPSLWGDWAWIGWSFEATFSL